jgi:hypothetical protein
MRSRKYHFFTHFFASAFLLLMPIIDAPSPKPTALLMLDNPYVVTDFVVHGICVAFGYLNFYLLVPAFFFRKKRVVYSSIVAASFLAICFLPGILARIPKLPFFEERDALQIHIIIQTRHIFFLFMVIFLLSLITRVERRLRLVEQEKSLAEIRYLKAQINPHFLFNTLNSIYSLLQINPSAAGASLIKMSNIMRYMLEASETTYEPLQQAITYLEDYIGLHKERFRNTVEVVYNFSGSAAGHRLATLLLIPFVENAFKYGVDPAFPSKILISIAVEHNELRIQVKNTDFSLHQPSHSGTGIGILNTKKRLELLYRDRYRLSIGNRNSIFLVDLSLRLE